MSERGWLLLSASAAGLGTALSGYDYHNGMVWWVISGNSASGQILGSPHPDLGWFPIGTFQGGNGQSGSAILSAAYGHLNASALWISAGSNLTGTLSVFAHWGR